MIQWFNAALNKCLFSAALQAICFKYKCMVNHGITILNSSVVECLCSIQKVPGSISWARYTFYLRIATCCSCSIYYLLYMMHLLIGAKPGLLDTFYFHWSINVYAALD